MKKYIVFLFIVSALAIGQSVFAQGLLPSSVECEGSNLPQCIKTFYQFGVGAVAILAVIVMMWGGLMWTTSGGNVSRIENAKEWIYGSVLGLVIALSSFLLLNTINPQLTILKLGLPENIDRGEILANKICCIITEKGEPDKIKGRILITSALAGEGCSSFVTQTQDAIQNPDPEVCNTEQGLNKPCGANLLCDKGLCYKKGDSYYKLDCILGICSPNIKIDQVQEATCTTKTFFSY